MVISDKEDDDVSYGLAIPHQMQTQINSPTSTVSIQGDMYGNIYSGTVYEKRSEIFTAYQQMND